MEFSSSKIKKNYYNFGYRTFWPHICFIFQEEISKFEKQKNQLWKYFLCFLKKVFLYNSGKGTFLYFLKKVFLLFREMKLSSSSLKHFFFQEEFPKPERKFNILLFVEKETFKHKRKRKKFLILFLIKKQNFLY